MSLTTKQQSRTRKSPGSAFFIPALTLVLLLCSCAKTQAPPPLTVDFMPDPGTYLAKNGTALTVGRLMEMAADKDYILIGEHHTNPCDHGIQHQLVHALSDRLPAMAIGLEMVGVDKQPVLDRFNAGDLPLDDLEKKLDWEKRWGYPFALFKPIFARALEKGHPVYGLNTPAHIARKAGKEGVESLTPEEKATLPERIIDPPEEQLEMLRMALAFHKGGQDPDSNRVKRFIMVQSIWDSRMAQGAVEARQATGAPVLVIAGSGHVDFGHGIAHRLRVLDPGARIMVISPWRSNQPLEPSEADAFFFCPLSHVSKLGMVLEERFGRVVVYSVSPDSRADKAGVRPGDIILKGQGIVAENLFSLHQAGTKAHREDAPLVLTVLRGPEAIELDLGKLGQPKSGPKEKGGAKPGEASK